MFELMPAQNLGPGSSFKRAVPSRFFRLNPCGWSNFHRFSSCTNVSMSQDAHRAINDFRSLHGLVQFFLACKHRASRCKRQNRRQQIPRSDCSSSLRHTTKMVMETRWGNFICDIRLIFSRLFCSCWSLILLGPAIPEEPFLRKKWRWSLKNWVPARELWVILSGLLRRMSIIHGHDLCRWK